MHLVAAYRLTFSVTFIGLRSFDQVGNGNSSDVVIKSPVLLLHADNDKIINCNHSRLLHQYRTMLSLPSELFIQASTDTFVKGHNFFDYEKDVLQPAKVFNLCVA